MKLNQPEESEREQPKALNHQQALALAMRIHQRREFDDAEQVYKRILETWPDSPDAWHYYGMLEFQRDNEKEGIAAVRKAIELHPPYFDAHANLGNMLLTVGRVQEAAHHLNRALTIKPDAMQPRVALSVMLRVLKRIDEAEAMIRPALDLEEGRNSAAVHNSIANVLAVQERTDEAIEHFRRAHELNPDLDNTRARLAFILAYTGKLEEAASLFARRLTQAPDDAEAKHMLAACGGAPVPDRASDSYVRNTFDGFANSFDAKLESLEYRAPELIARAIELAIGASHRSLKVLDAGCGTGLLGVLIRPSCARLIGVDLSPGMMRKAKDRKVYDELHEAELTAYLQNKSAIYDVVTSADTLCYIGAIDEVCKAAQGALKPDGWFFFSVEHGLSQSDDYAIQFHGRYAHTRKYVEDCLKGAGFPNIEIVEDTLRTELGKPVPGLIVAAQRGA